MKISILRYNSALAAGLAICPMLAGCGAVSTYEVQQPPIAEMQSAEQKPSAALRELTADEKTILSESFTFGLNEPESVKFLWSKVPVETSKLRRSFDYCGKLSSKNEKVVYQGMQPFLAIIVTENGSITGGSIVKLQQSVGSPAQNDVPDLCRQKGLS
jgi:hypothetical protein